MTCKANVFPSSDAITKSCRSSHCDLVLLHMDPAREGVCAARSIHSPEAEKATLSFSAQSMMQGAPETLNMMGGLTSAVWSRDLPTCSCDTGISGITCRKAAKIKMSYVLVCMVLACRMLGHYSRDCNTNKSQGKSRTEKLTLDGWSPVYIATYGMLLASMLLTAFPIIPSAERTLSLSALDMNLV